MCVHTYVNKFYILILSSEFIPIHLEILKLKQFQFTYLQIDFRAKDLSASLWNLSVRQPEQPGSLPWVVSEAARAAGQSSLGCPQAPPVSSHSHGSVCPASASPLLSRLSQVSSLLIRNPHVSDSQPWVGRERGALQPQPLQSVGECQPVSRMNLFPFHIILTLFWKSEPQPSPADFQSSEETVNANTGVLKGCWWRRPLFRGTLGALSGKLLWLEFL